MQPETHPETLQMIAPSPNISQEFLPRITLDISPGIPSKRYPRIFREVHLKACLKKLAWFTQNIPPKISPVISPEVFWKLPSEISLRMTDVVAPEFPTRFFVKIYMKFLQKIFQKCLKELLWGFFWMNLKILQKYISRQFLRDDSWKVFLGIPPRVPRVIAPVFRLWVHAEISSGITLEICKSLLNNLWKTNWGNFWSKSWKMQEIYEELFPGSLELSLKELLEEALSLSGKIFEEATEEAWEVSARVSWIHKHLDFMRLFHCTKSS